MSVLAGASGISINGHLNAVAGHQHNYFYKDDAPTSDWERKAIANWLSSLDFDAYQSRIFRKRSGGTGQWLLESHEFVKWRDSVSEVLFCPGMPGAGKTVMSSIIINHLQRLFKDSEKTATIYIYLDYTNQSQQTPLNLVSDLLKQLIQRRFVTLENINSLYKLHQNGINRPTMEDITKALEIEIAKHDKVFTVVDGIDELSEDNGARAQLLSVLRSLAGPINLVVTSRNLPSVAIYFQDTVHLEIYAHDGDVRNFVQGRIPRWYPGDLAQMVTDEVVRKADGMFLLAQLHLDSLVGKHSIAQVKQKLKNLPSGMENAFDEAMRRVELQNEYDRALAMRALSWITFASRPLSVSELQCALSVVPGMTGLHRDELIIEECLTSYCAGLIVIDPESHIIRLVHYSAQEYFINRRDSIFPDAQAYITRTCLTYLLFDEFGRDYSADAKELFHSLIEYPLLDYANRYWGHHARGQVELTERSLLQRFLRCRHQVDCCSRILLINLHLGMPSSSLSAVRFNHLPSYLFNRPGFSPLHLCSFFGLCKTIEYQLENGAEADSRDSEDRTPLSWAAHNGHKETVSFLLARNDVNVNARDQYLRTPLFWAAMHSRNTVVSVLLAHQAIQVNLKDCLGRTSLSSPARNGHYTTFSLLLSHPVIDINAPDLDGVTPLLEASENRHNAIIATLLARDDIDPNSRDDSGRTALCWAVHHGNDEAVQLLVAHPRIAVNFKNALGRTSLSDATALGHTCIVKLLLGHETVEPNMTDNAGQTPLWRAMQNGHFSVVNLLLANNHIEINSPIRNRTTPLMWAIENHRDDIVFALLARKDIDVNRKDRLGRAPLSWAVQKGNEIAVKQLLAHPDIDVDVQDANGRTPLSYAAGSGQDAVVGLLLTRSTVDVNSRDKEGRTPLSWAAENHQSIVEQLFLKEDIDCNIADIHGRTPLFYTYKNAHTTLIDLFLAHETVDVNFQDSDGQTPLTRAVIRGQDRMVRLLLENKRIDVNLADNSGGRPLSYAVTNRHLTIVNILLAHKAIDVNFQDGYGRTPLCWAAIRAKDIIVKRLAYKKQDWGRFFTERKRHLTVWRLLCDATLDINTQDRDGRTPLSHAAENGDNDIVDLLLTRKTVDVNLQDNGGRTPLSWAAARGHLRIVERLTRDSGVDASLRDNDGRTALELAELNGHTRIVQHLVEANVEVPSIQPFESYSSRRRIDSPTRHRPD